MSAAMVAPTSSGFGVLKGVLSAERGRPVVSAAIVAPSSWPSFRELLPRKTVSASSGNDGSTPVRTEEGSCALQAAQLPAFSDTSPPQFGHLIKGAVSGPSNAVEIMWLGLEISKPKGVSLSLNGLGGFLRALEH